MPGNDLPVWLIGRVVDSIKPNWTKETEIVPVARRNWTFIVCGSRERPEHVRARTPARRTSRRSPKVQLRIWLSALLRAKAGVRGINDSWPIEHGDLIHQTAGASKMMLSEFRQNVLFKHPRIQLNNQPAGHVPGVGCR